MSETHSVNRYQRFDHGLARIEAGLAVGVLLSMVVVASAQALFFNIAQRDVAWATAVLEHISWADEFLQKGTLWLAFIGASLATHEDKHIAIDVVPKLLRGRAMLAMRTVSATFAGLIALLLGWVFFRACLVADAAIPFEYEVLGSDGRAHVCDVSAGELGQTSRPAVLCALRDLLARLGVSVSSGGGVAQLIAPLMLLIMGVRLLVRAFCEAMKLGGMDARRSAPEQGSVSGGSDD